jgi:hypothetical protein
VIDEDKIISTTKYVCPVCGSVNRWIDVSIAPFKGKYCLTCCAEWINKTFPRLEQIPYSAQHTMD